MGKKFKVTMEVDVPQVPNFLRMPDGQTVPISAISEEGLRELGALWIEALIVRSIEQRTTATMDAMKRA